MRFPVELILQDPVLYISFPLVWSLLDFFAANSDVEDGFNNAGILGLDTSDFVLNFTLTTFGAIHKIRDKRFQFLTPPTPYDNM